MNTVYIDDVGTEIILDTGSSLAGATATEIIVHKPDGTVTEWAGSVYESTKIRYIAQPGDLDTAGRYRLQARIALPTWEGHGGTVELIVRRLGQ